MLKHISHPIVPGSSASNTSLLELRLARPPANALTIELICALRDAVREAPKHGVKAIILSGAPKMFSAGLDVPSLLPLDRAGIFSLWSNFFDLMRVLAFSPIPVAAALTGHSPAGGAVISLFCDYRVMAEGRYKIGMNEVQVGLPVPPIIFGAFSYLVGARAAERLSVLGELILPDEALRLGLVDAVVPVDEVVQGALQWCRRLLQLPQEAVGSTRDLTRKPVRSLFDDLDDCDNNTVNKFVDIWFSDETQGAMQTLVKRLGQAS